MRTTNNFWDAFLLKAVKGTTKKIKFTNGIVLELNYKEYDTLRYWFENLKKNSYQIAFSDNSWIIYNSSKPDSINFKVTNLISEKAFFDFLLLLKSRGWLIHREGNQYEVEYGNNIGVIECVEGEFHFKSNQIEIYGQLQALMVYFNELFDAEAYKEDFVDKTVLDIGGFCGETAVYFARQGAKKVVIYEPIIKHQKIIEKNLKANNVVAEVHPEGIGNEDGIVTVNYDLLDTGVGLDNTGKYQTKIKTRNISRVIKESNANIAKIDCEGAEISLITVTPEVLGLINHYIIETHSEEIKKAIESKFLSAGFQTYREPISLAKGISVLYFERLPDVRY